MGSVFFFLSKGVWGGSGAPQFLGGGFSWLQNYNCHKMVAKSYHPSQLKNCAQEHFRGASSTRPGMSGA